MALLVQNCGQVIEEHWDDIVSRLENLACNLETLPLHLLRFGELSFVLKRSAEVKHGAQRVPVLRAVLFLLQRESLPPELLCFLKLLFLHQSCGEIAHRVESASVGGAESTPLNLEQVALELLRGGSLPAAIQQNGQSADGTKRIRMFRTQHSALRFENPAKQALGLRVAAALGLQGERQIGDGAQGVWMILA